MHPLQLPPIEPKLQRNASGQLTIFDPSRKKYVVLTPEEWVRQHVIAYLHTQLGYPLGHIQAERGLQYNRLQKRTDIVVYNTAGQPEILIECKSFEIAIQQHHFVQTSMYNNTLNCKFFGLTNGITHYYYAKQADGWHVCEGLPAYIRG